MTPLYKKMTSLYKKSTAVYFEVGGGYFGSTPSHFGSTPLDKNSSTPFGVMRIFLDALIHGQLPVALPRQTGIERFDPVRGQF
ncbi:hypothetical protein [Cognataquiflexum aquatile]|uniref:hypothetical protein n=1 Tax=Cognataquiflexum aquatile TaxID=2249427 RepID=UPI001300A278|nr:hypothetical protein [Cognataquiflexum aquatile]